MGWKKGNGRFANSISSLLNPTQQIRSRRYALQLRFSSHSRCVSEPLLSLRSLCLSSGSFSEKNKRSKKLALTYLSMCEIVFFFFFFYGGKEEETCLWSTCVSSLIITDFSWETCVMFFICTENQHVKDWKMKEFILHTNKSPNSDSASTMLLHAQLWFVCLLNYFI